MAVIPSRGGSGFPGLLFPARPFFEGDRMQLRVSIEEIIDMNVLSEYFSDNGLDKEDLRADPDAEVYITGAEAEKYGFIGPKRTGRNQGPVTLFLF
jgi:ATP-dependent protease ClpP protease subunit